MARQRLGARTARPAGAQAASGLISPPQAVHLERADSRPRAQKLQFNRTRAACGKIEAGVGKISRLLARDTT